MSTETDDLFEKALRAEPRLRAIDQMVRTFVALAPSRRSNKTMCAGCIWELILKPLATPLVGWSRGRPPEQVREPRASRRVDLTPYLRDDRAVPENETEAWMRSMSAWDAVTGRWLKMLDDADPAKGHGLGSKVAA